MNSENTENSNIVLVGKSALYSSQIQKVLDIANELCDNSLNYKNLFRHFQKVVEESNDKEKALDILTKEISANPRNADAYYWLGIVHSRYYIDKTEELANYQSAEKIFFDQGRDGDGYRTIGHILQIQGNYKEAIKHAEKALQINPNDAYAYNGLGRAYSGLKEYQAAIANYTSAIRLKPNFSQAFRNRGLDCEQLKDYAGAIEDYTKAICIKPNYAYAYGNRGRVRYNYLKDYAGAIEDYTKATRIDPDLAYVYYNWGLASKKLGDREMAIENFRKAANLYQKQGNKEYYQKSLNQL